MSSSASASASASASQGSGRPIENADAFDQRSCQHTCKNPPCHYFHVSRFNRDRHAETCGRQCPPLARARCAACLQRWPELIDQWRGCVAAAESTLQGRFARKRARYSVSSLAFEGASLTSASPSPSAVARASATPDEDVAMDLMAGNADFTPEPSVELETLKKEHDTTVLMLRVVFDSSLLKNNPLRQRLLAEVRAALNHARGDTGTVLSNAEAAKLLGVSRMRLYDDKEHFELATQELDINSADSTPVQGQPQPEAPVPAQQGPGARQRGSDRVPDRTGPFWFEQVLLHERRCACCAQALGRIDPSISFQDNKGRPGFQDHGHTPLPSDALQAAI